jgi:uncharacterized SAM-binding protein YcdF (DUF218 family)
MSVRETKSLYIEAKSGAPYDVIIVPGYPFKNNTWDDLLKARIFWSWFLYDRGITKNVIYSGSAVYSPFVESEIMRLYGMALGIPGDHIYTETHAEHSTENVFYAYHMAKKMGFQRIALATDPFQSKMLRRFVRKKIGKDIGFVPIIYDSLSHMDTLNIAIDPTTAFVDNFVPLTDRESFWERLKGTRGGKIDYNSFE